MSKYMLILRIVQELFVTGQKAMAMLDRADKEGRDVSDEELAELDAQADAATSELKQALGK